MNNRTQMTKKKNLRRNSKKCIQKFNKGNILRKSIKLRFNLQLKLLLRLKEQSSQIKKFHHQNKFEFNNWMWKLKAIRITSDNIIWSKSNHFWKKLPFKDRNRFSHLMKAKIKNKLNQMMKHKGPMIKSSKKSEATFKIKI